ncbi:MAG: hypothetical protein J2P54_02540 [Bradyrhizobiaceae bacterium]|nr:hypothetical protein [Bradyrhizobiaceae bacterium]
MVYGQLPVFLITVLGRTTRSVGLIEGATEATSSFIKFFSGAASANRSSYSATRCRRLVFPLAQAASVVVIARIIDRVGKGIRHAPRDAFPTDVMPSRIRGRRFFFYATIFVIGPLAAIGIMRSSGDDFQLVFWIAAIPAFLSVVVLVTGVKELPRKRVASQRRQFILSTLHRCLRHFGGRL